MLNFLFLLSNDYFNLYLHSEKWCMQNPEHNLKPGNNKILRAIYLNGVIPKERERASISNFKVFSSVYLILVHQRNQQNPDFDPSLFPPGPMLKVKIGNKD